MRYELGEPVTLLGDGALGLSYFPDMGVVPLDRTDGERLLVTAGNRTYLVEGESLTSLTAASVVLEPGAPGEFDNGYAGISAGLQTSEGAMFGFYHAEDHEGLPVIEPSGVPGYYGSIGAAVSHGGGRTWEKLGQVITSSVPKFQFSYEGQADSGADGPGLVLEKSGRYAYLYYTEHSRVDERGIVICMARADLSQGDPAPGAWHKYYNGEFTEPGIGGRDTPVITAEMRDDAEPMYPRVVYSPALQQYLMVLNVNFWREYLDATGPEHSGVFYALSDDGIRWSEPRRLWVDFALPQPGRSLSWEVTFLPDDLAGDRGWLVYGYSENWPTVPHYMVGRRFEIWQN